MKRCEKNPLVRPDMVRPSRDGYRVRGAFNPGATVFGDEILILMRIAEDCLADDGRIAVPYYDFDHGKGRPEILELSRDDPDLELEDTRAVLYRGREYLSTLGHLRLARSRDGVNFTVDPEPFIRPDSPEECFGVEDARMVRIGDDYYINFTVVSGDGYATALACTRDFETVERRGIVFPPLNKDVCIFPEKVNGVYCALHRPWNIRFGKPSVWYAESPDLVHWGNHKCLIRPRDNGYEGERIGGGSSPIKTPEGWLEVYHGKSENEVYCLMLLLLDLDNPSRVIKRGSVPVLAPETPYEKEGFVPNVVFSNGLVQRDNGRLFVYYGACDETVCMAETSVEELLGMLL